MGGKSAVTCSRVLLGLLLWNNVLTLIFLTYLYWGQPRILGLRGKSWNLFSITRTAKMVLGPLG